MKWIQCDYESETFKFLIEAYFQEGKVDQVVVWMHSSANENLQWLIQYLNVYHISLYHVRGSQGYSTIFDDHLKNTINYHQIILGYERQDHHNRWLSNEEISNGVIEAVKAKKKVHIVGHFDGQVESVLF